ncbi:phage baseplate assembly protein V [Aeromonas hydrophila]|uniref:phage baseplate assembly protein V n=1 Tax=Aeromonas hydrophila TaxID=644 RepID=UPI0005739D5C|nr:phage baseplate assembly protein V [Aeromonas hydrophila]KHN58281.1 baseplate assembly protein [Aeromonas hydrophila]OFC46387.1 baseplate assembly protein [Aeromonas hydrophila]OFC52205.1 baseplate assembly protein [Aeromonas hydrophila]
MQLTLIELQRQLDNLIRIGTVIAVRSGECRVKSGNNKTDWRPYITERAGNNRTRHRLSIGEQVMLLSVSGDLRNAYIVGSLNAAAADEPLADDDNPDLDRTEYADGAIIEYNPATGALNASGIKTATITASVSVKANTPLVECSGLLKAKRVISETANIGGIEVTTHKHSGVSTGGGQTGGPV